MIYNSASYWNVDLSYASNLRWLIKELREFKTKMFPIDFEIIYLQKDTYDIVIGIWLIRNLCQGKRMVGLVQI